MRRLATLKQGQSWRQILELDPLSGAVRPDAVYCRNCERWIYLSKYTDYDLEQWEKHCASQHARSEYAHQNVTDGTRDS